MEPMLVVAAIAATVIMLLIIFVILVTRKEFRKMSEHPEEFQRQYSGKPKEH